MKKQSCHDMRKSIFRGSLPEISKENFFKRLQKETASNSRRESPKPRCSTPECAGKSPRSPNNVKVQSQPLTDGAGASLLSGCYLFEPQSLVVHLNHFLVRLLSSGPKSKVYLCLDSIDQRFKALKVVSEKNKSKSGTTEAEVLRILNSRLKGGVPKYFESWTEQNKVFIKMELCEKNLSKRMEEKRLAGETWSEEEILKFLGDLLPVIDQLHSLGYAHLDIKPGSPILLEITFYWSLLLEPKIFQQIMRLKPHYQRQRRNQIFQTAI